MPSPTFNCINVGQSTYEEVLPDVLVHNTFNALKNDYKKLSNFNNKLIFINRCLSEGLYPKNVENVVNLKSVNLHRQDNPRLELLSNMYKVKIMRLQRRDVYINLRRTYFNITQRWKILNRLIDRTEFNILNKKLENFYCKEFDKISSIHYKKLKNLRKDSVKNYINVELGKEKFVENLTDLPIPDDVVRGLALGPKFGFIDQKEKTVLGILGCTEAYIGRIKNDHRQKICRNKINNSVLNFINRRNNNYQNKKVEQLITSQIRAAKLFKKQNEERIVLLNSDKSNSVVIMDREDYNMKSKIILEDTSKYSLIDEKKVKDPVGRVERKINQSLKQSFDRGMLSKNDYEQLRPKNSMPGLLYFLVKSHKENFPLRPVITSYDTPNRDLSKYLARILRVIVCQDHRIKNSSDLLGRMNGVRLSEGQVLASFDVVNLFPSIPLNIVRERIKNKWDLIEQVSNFTLEAFMELFDLCLDSNIFLFEKQFYKQVSGCPIGGCVSSVIADVFIDYVHEKVFSKFPIERIYYYVDDSLCIVDKNVIVNILEALNDINPNIKYTCELEKEGSIHFLDLTILKDEHGNLKTNHYEKPQKSARSINYFSHHPHYQKINIIKNEVSRVLNNSHPQFHNKNIEKLRNKFVLNNYPFTLIDRICQTALFNRRLSPGIQRTHKTEENLSIVGSIPYLPGLSEIIKSILRRFNINITFKINKPLNTILNNKCGMEFFDRAGLVYAVPCASCSKENDLSIYIGETGRRLKVRLKEHYYSVAKSLPKSALSIHSLEHKHEFDYEKTKILHYEKDGKKRKFYESFFITLYDDVSINLKIESEKTALVYSDVLNKIKNQFYNLTIFDE